MSEETKKYYGTKIVKQMSETSDGLVVGLLLEDDTMVNVPKWEADLLVTDSPIDPVDERNIRSNYVCGKLLEVLRDLDVRVLEIEYVLDKVKNSLFDGHVGTINTFFNTLIKRASNGVYENQKNLCTGFVDTVLKDEAAKSTPVVT